MKEEKRIYVVVPAIVEVAADTYFHNGVWKVNLLKGVKDVVQPAGRQIAQACHVVSKLRHERGLTTMKDVENKLYSVYTDITTIILQARDSKEMIHNFRQLTRKRLEPVFFSDENVTAYGNFRPITAMAVYAKPSQVKGVLDYLPLWGSYEQSSRCV